MNDKVDTRVVRMEFDNKQFEKNVKQTSKSLNDLKQNLDFKGVGDSLDKVRVKISALEVAATTFVVNLTNRLITLGVTITKSLSVDNIASGWEKFGNKTISVATMMAQKIRIAGREITDMAEQTEVVNKQLELLTWFADETSYSFTDMVDNVGKFIAAGQDLDTSVKAMEGIANWAALSGQNAQTASRAMYQLAQALGKGKVALQDWMSIQNANMDTEEFRATILATAVAMGKLTQEGDKFITKTGKKFTQSEFTKYLSEGWFTSDVLVAGLGKYSAAVEQIYALANRDGITASEVIEKYGDQLDEFGVKAFKAAQEARTFTDVLNSIKDAVSSKWMTTFEEIFGGKDESIKTWTELANELYDVFAESGNFRNNMLSIWGDMGGRNDIFGKHGDPNQGAFWNLYDAIIAVKDLIASAWNTIFPISEMEDENDRAKSIARTLKNLTEILKRATEQWKNNAEQATLLRKIFDGLFSILRLGLVTIQAIRYVLEPVFDTLKRLISQVLNRIVSLTGGLDNILMGIVRAAEYLRSRIEDIIEIINPSNVLNSVFSVLKNVWAVIKEINPIERLFSLVTKILQGLNDGGGTVNNLRRILSNVIKIVKSAISIVLNVAKALSSYLLPILESITNVLGYLFGFISGIVVETIAVISDILASIDDLINGIGSIADIGGTIRNFLIFIPQTLKVINPLLTALTAIVSKLVEAVMLIPKVLDQISVRITGKGIVDNLRSLFDSISKSILDFVNGIESKAPAKTGSFAGLINALTYFFQGLVEALKGLVSAAQAVLTVLGSVLYTVGKALQGLSDIIIKVFSGRWKDLSEAQKSIVKTIVVLGAVVGVLYILYTVVWQVISALNPFGTVVDSIVGVIDKVAFGSLASSLNVIANGVLQLAVALYIFRKAFEGIDKGVLETVLIVAAVIGSIIAIIYLINSITDAISLFGKEAEKSIKEVKEAKKKLEKNGSIMSDISKVVASIGSLLLKFALAALILDRISPENFENVRGMLIQLMMIIGGIIVALSIILAVMSSKASVLKKGEKQVAMPVITLIVTITAFVTAAKLLAKTLVEIGSIPADAWNRGMVTLGVIGGSIVALMTIMAVLSATVKKKKKGSKKTDLPKLLLSMAAVFGSIGVAVAAIAGSLALLSTISPSKLIAPVLAIVAIMGALTAAAILMSKFGGSGGNGAAVAILAMAAAILAISAAIYIMSKAIDALSGKGPQIAEFFANIGNGIVALVSALLGGVSVWLGQLFDILETYVPRLIQFVIGVVVQLLKAISDNIDTILTYVGQILNSILTFGLKFIASNASAIISAVVQVVHVLITSLAENLPKMMEDIMALVMMVLDVIVNTVIPLLPQILLKVWNAIMSLLGQQEMTEEEAQQLFQPFMDAIGSIIGIVKDLLAEIGPALKEFFNAIREVLKAINPIITAIINVITDFIKAIDWEVITKIITTLLGFIGTILGVIADVLNTVFEILSPIIETIVKVLSPILKVIGELLKTIFGLLEPFIPILEAIFKVVGAIVKVGIELINGFFKGIKEGWSKAWEGIQKVFGGFLNWIKKLFGIHSPSTVFAGYGDNIIVGLKNGLEESSKKNEKGIKGVFNKIGNWFKEKFGINSPSKVFTQYGEYMMAGLAIGLDDGVKEQKTAMQHTLSTLSSSLEDYLDVNEDDITIKVGMDISGVEEQSKNVRGIMSSISNYSGSISGAYGASASNASGEINRVSAAKARALAKAESEDHSASSYTDNTTNNNVFNIQSSKPKEVAEEVDKILQERVLSKKLARGGI